MPSEKTLSDLRKELRELDNKVKDLLWGKLRPPDSRPFVCNGDPYECKAFIVGCNPASGLRKSSFWEYWPDDDETGFKREEWLRAYESERPLSRTRQNINLIVSRAGAQPHPVKVLETNVYSIPTPSERELRGILKQMDGGVESAAAIFVRLLVEVKPKVIFLHGQTAREAFMNEVSFQPRPETLSTFEFAQSGYLVDSSKRYMLRSRDLAQVPPTTAL